MDRDKDEKDRFSLRMKQNWDKPEQRMKYFEDSDDDDTLQMCLYCGQTLPRRALRIHQKKCQVDRECKFCHVKLLNTNFQEHQTLCRKNPHAKAMRKLYPSSSDPSDSSDEEHQQKDNYHDCDLGPKEREYPQSSDEQNLTQQQQRYRDIFKPKPKRQCRLSESSSEQDQRTKYWRNYQQNFSNEVPSSFYVGELRTGLPGISITFSSEGRHGRIIRRTVYNSVTKERKTISDHHFQRHYRAHVIEPEEQNQHENSPNQNGALTLTISNTTHLVNFNLGHEVEAEPGLTSAELDAMQRFKINKSAEQNESCAICCSEYEDGESVMKLVCLHTFHEECITLWLKQKPSCPLCKAKQK